MKQIIFVAMLILSFNSWTQTEKEIKAISESTCECLEEKDIEAGNMQKIEMELGVCMLKAISKNDVDVDMSQEREMTKIGEKIGFELAVTCPRFLELLGNMAEEDPEGFQEMVEDHQDSKKTQFSTLGKVKKIEAEDFVTITIMNTNGRKETFYWLQHFPGAQLIEEKDLMNQKVKIEFETIEFYSPKIEDYTTMKILRKLSLR